MRRKVLTAVLGVLIAAVLTAQTSQGREKSSSPSDASRGRSALVLPIHGEIDAPLTVFLRRSLADYRNKMPEVVIFDIDTFGGRVDSALQITTLIGSLRDTETLAWVHGGPDGTGVSWSAGALISLSCRRIAMAPGTSMGAAAPVFAGPDGAMTMAPEKTVSAVRTQMAALAEKNGYPKGVALAMVDSEVELFEAYIGERRVLATADDLPQLEREAANEGKKLERGRVISPKGKLLSLTAGEMEEYGLSLGSHETLDSLYEVLGVDPAKAEVLELGADDEAVALITGAAFTSLLILIGLVALFLEITSPGFGVPGTIAIVCFSVLFAGNFLLGRVGSLEILLFLAGLALLVVEIFLLPGFGVAGISGIIAIGLSLIFAMQDFVLPSFDWQWDLFRTNLALVGANVLGSVIVFLVLMALSPKFKLFRGITLEREFRAEEGYSAFSEEQALLGRQGTALTTLRPAGKVDLGDRIVVADADGGFIEQDAPVVVVRVEGVRIIVRRR